jgi:hypothetical protein
MNWKYATSYGIEKIIRSLKTKNTSGYAEISDRIIKSNSAYIISPLTHICNAILGYRSGGPGSIPGTTEKKSSGFGTGSTQPRKYN